MTVFESALKNLKNEFDIKLRQILKIYENSSLYDCIEYAVFSGGKRLRPLFYLETIKAFGGTINEEDFTVAAAIEFLHTYTLVHDDMPCMDNDDYRRGRLTLHKQFNEAIALLTGDALQSIAIELLTKVSIIGENYLRASREFFKYAGVMGVIDGQSLEIRYKDKIQQNIEDIYLKKTSALLTAPLIMAAEVLDLNNEVKTDLSNFGKSFGFAFQLSDDLLDVKKDKDISFATIFGVEKTKSELKKYSDLSCELAAKIFNKGFFVDISAFVASRNY